MSQWRLPENLKDLLPAQAKNLELYRRTLLDLYQSKGYQFVMPSLLEFEDSLNAHGKDLDLDTYKVVDQLSGKMMGLTSDLTTQTARIDAYLCQDQRVNKLCYAGPAIRTKSSRGQSRELYQVGLECFGDATISADIEVQSTLIESLKLLNIKDIVLDINHLDVYQLIVSRLDITPQDRLEIAQATTIKDKAGLKILLARFGKNSDADQLVNLLDMYGDKAVIQELKSMGKDDKGFKKVISDLDALVGELEKLDVKLSFDFSDIRGYQYHSGLIFSAYSPRFKSVIAQGGRYDNLNKSLGIIRPATGFSMDLRYFVSYL
jgi:ATP phosphoribosyltransferase regulatory subunit